MDEYVDTGESLDVNARTVSYTFSVVPGEVYRIRTVTPVNLPAAALSDFNQIQRIRPGDVYDVDYVSHLIENNSALRSLAGYSATYQAVADPNTHLVDLTIKFLPGGNTRGH